MRSPKKPSARNERRAAERAAEKLVRDREKLASLEVGGAPDRPIEVTTASLVEPTAVGLRCARCQGALRVEEHAARTIDDVPLRIVTCSCARCGAKRIVYVRIVTVMPS